MKTILRFCIRIVYQEYYFFNGRNYCDVVKLQQRNLCCWAILCQMVTQIRVFQDVNHSIL